MNRAIDACIDAAESRAGNDSADVRVRDIEGVEQQQDGYRVRGALERRDLRRDARSSWYPSGHFKCHYARGAVDRIELEDDYASR